MPAGGALDAPSCPLDAPLVANARLLHEYALRLHNAAEPTRRVIRGTSLSLRSSYDLLASTSPRLTPPPGDAGRIAAALGPTVARAVMRASVIREGQDGASEDGE